MSYWVTIQADPIKLDLFWYNILLSAIVTIGNKICCLKFVSQFYSIWPFLVCPIVYLYSLKLQDIKSFLVVYICFGLKHNLKLTYQRKGLN